MALASVLTNAQRLIGSAGYAGLAVLMVVENVFPPIPSEIVLPFAGYQVSRGQLSFIGAVLAATVGSVIGAWIIYAVGRLGGRSLILRLHPLLRMTGQDIDRAGSWFERRGDWIVLGARVVPGARSVVSVPAGILRMPFVRFSALTALGSAVWNTALIAAGQHVGSNWEQIGAVIGPISTTLAALAGAGGLVAVLAWRRKARRATK